MLLFVVLAALVIAMFFVPPIPQSESYHHFADTRSLGAIPNAGNALSNLFFLMAGLLGLRLVLSGRKPGEKPLFIDPAEKWPYALFFLGVTLTTFGSGYYHAGPDDARLV